MNFTEGFGKKWIDRILGKVDKDQGVANAGKVLGIGADGRVTPVEQSGGGSSVWNESVSISSYADLVGKIKVGDELIATVSVRSIGVRSTDAVFTPITDNILRLTTFGTTTADENKTFHLTVTSIDESNKIIHCASNLLSKIVFGQPYVSPNYINTQTLNLWYVDSIKEANCVVSWTYLIASESSATNLGEVLRYKELPGTRNYTVTTIIHKT